MLHRPFLRYRKLQQQVFSYESMKKTPWWSWTWRKRDRENQKYEQRLKGKALLKPCERNKAIKMKSANNQLKAHKAQCLLLKYPQFLSQSHWEGYSNMSILKLLRIPWLEIRIEQPHKTYFWKSFTIRFSRIQSNLYYRQICKRWWGGA